MHYHHHEVGGPGQCEIELTRQPLLQAADGTMWAKHVIKNLAVRQGLSPTFMPKPLYNEAGSGMHFHQNLLSEGRNLFFDPEGLHGLSEIALHYIGGLLKHGRALLAELARICVQRGYERLEWSVLDWNRPAIGFYESLGARPQDEWTVYRLTDGALAALGGSGH